MSTEVHASAHDPETPRAAASVAGFGTVRLRFTPAGQPPGREGAWRSAIPSAVSRQTTVAGRYHAVAEYAGGRPLASIYAESGSTRACWLVGELYNRAAIEDGLQLERGLSDATLFGRLYERYGEHAPRFVNGRFAAIIVDGDVILLVTDHAGTVPLYFATVSDAVLVSTEQKLLLPYCRSRQFRVDDEAVGEADPSQGLFEEIRRAPNGSISRVSGGVSRWERYWDLPHVRHLGDVQDAARQLRAALDRAVQLRISGPRVGLVLSGGIDSSAIAGLLSRHAADVQTFSLGTETGNEYPFAEIVARHCGTTHHELQMGDEELIESFPMAIWKTEIVTPRYLEYVAPLANAYERVSRHCSHVMTGYGSDILFAGMIQRDSTPAAVERFVIDEYASTDGPNEFSHLLGEPHGIKTVHPFWDRDVMECACTIDGGLKLRNGIEKFVLREACSDLLPQAIVWRQKLGIHEATGIRSIFAKWLSRFGVEPFSVERVQRRVIRLIAERMFLEDCAPQDVDMTQLTESAVRV